MIVKMPDPFKANRLPTFPAGANPAPDLVARFQAIDSKCRMHNMARRIAMLPHKEARDMYWGELKMAPASMAPALIERLKRLARWYWRAQRKKQRADQAPKAAVAR